MARKEQLNILATIARDNLKCSGLQVTSDDFVEIVAILTWRQHAQGNSEGQAHVKAKSWPKVSPSWQGKYRSLARKALAKQ